MNAIDNWIMIYMKNERGVCVPIHVKSTDHVRVLLLEAATTRAIHRGTLEGKAFYYKGRRLNSDEVIGDIGITSYDTVRLQLVDKSSTVTESPHEDDHRIVATDHGPMD